MTKWEFSFKLEADDRSAAKKFQIMVSSIVEPAVHIPNFPKDKLLRALNVHSTKNEYELYKGIISDLKIKKTNALDSSKEIHVLMLVLEKIGPITLVFSNKFEYLVLEGIDSAYEYIGHAALLNILIQIINPQSQTVSGLGKIKTIYHASNLNALKRSLDYVPLLDTPEGQILLLGISFLVPLVTIIVLPGPILESTTFYLLILGVLGILFCLFPFFKRSSRYLSVSLISTIVLYIFVEVIISFHFLVEGRNPWGIFNSIARLDLIGNLKRQTLIQSAGQGVFLGLEILQIVIPFLDLVFLAIIPLTIGLFLTLSVQKTENTRRLVKAGRIFAVLFFIVSLLTLPIVYHALGKGTEGTIYASIGLVETAEMFSPRFVKNLESNLAELQELIDSAKGHLEKAGNSFQQFGENPLISVVLPYFFPSVAGIPLDQIPNILNLTHDLGEAVPFYLNFLWAYFSFERGFNQSFQILSETISGQNLGFGAQENQRYNQSMLGALRILQLGLQNLTFAEENLLPRLSSARETLNFPTFQEIGNFLSELELGLPILVSVITAAIPWTNSTYKLTLALENLDQSRFSNLNEIENAESDYVLSQMALQDIEIEELGLPTQAASILPIRELYNFSEGLHSVTGKYLLAVKNATFMFQAFNTTLREIQAIDFANASNIADPKWQRVDESMTNTSSYLNATQSSLDDMEEVISQLNLNVLSDLIDVSQLLQELNSFTQSTSNRLDVINTYFNAFETTFESINYFSLGSNSLNASMTTSLGPPATSGNYTQARQNFTLSQVAANETDLTLAGISNHLLNDTAISNWRELVKGGVNSVYNLAERSLSVIDAIEANGSITTVTHVGDFALILVDMESLDWDIFA
ncbi:MAG: hypothetical protein ACFFFG_07105 [Candidatus Thorarchaeota archaeon]